MAMRAARKLKNGAFDVSQQRETGEGTTVWRRKTSPRDMTTIEREGNDTTHKNTARREHEWGRLMMMRIE